MISWNGKGSIYIPPQPKRKCNETRGRTWTPRSHAVHYPIGQLRKFPYGDLTELRRNFSGVVFPEKLKIRDIVRFLKARCLSDLAYRFTIMYHYSGPHRRRRTVLSNFFVHLHLLLPPPPDWFTATSSVKRMPLKLYIPFPGTY